MRQAYILTIAEVDEKHRFPRDNTNYLSFKVILEMSDDRNGTAYSEHVENVHFWWVRRETVESYILKAARTKSPEVAAAAAAAAVKAAAFSEKMVVPSSAQRLATGSKVSILSESRHPLSLKRRQKNIAQRALAHLSRTWMHA